MASPEKPTFGSYEVLQNPDGSPCVLGQGSFGVTYKARHVLLGRVTALKVIRADLLCRSSKADEEETNRFLDEARAVGRLHHPGIAMVHDCALDKGGVYYAMEYCDGGSLKNWCEKNGPMPWPEVRRIALQMASALDYAHASGFLHRDIKPANIMLHGKGQARQAKLIDFGLAKKLLPGGATSAATGHHDHHQFRGNLVTASPEQILEKPLDPRSDLFSLGITLWWLLLGKNPFGGMKRGPMIAKRLETSSYASSLPEDLAPEARELLDALLEKDAAKRIASAHLVVERLGSTATAAVAAEPVASPAVALVPLPGPPDLADDYAMGCPLATASQAKLYTGVHLATHQPVILIIPNATFDPDACGGMRIAASRKLDFGAYAFHDWRTSSGDDVFIISKPEGCSLMGILCQFGPTRLADALPLLAQLARCFDASHIWTTFAIQVDPCDILLRTRDGSSALDQFRAWSDLDPKSLRCLPLFNTCADPVASGDSTWSPTAQEFPPLAQFAALVYRILAGKAVRYAAFFRTDGGASLPALSAAGNALLADTICAPETQPSACRFVQELATLESLPLAEITPPFDPPNTQDIATGKFVPHPPPGPLSNVAARATPPADSLPAEASPLVSVSAKVDELERQYAELGRQLARVKAAAGQMPGRSQEEAQRLLTEPLRQASELAARLRAATQRLAEDPARQAAAAKRPPAEVAGFLAGKQAGQDAEAKRLKAEARGRQDNRTRKRLNQLVRQAAEEAAHRQTAAKLLAIEQARITTAHQLRPRSRANQHTDEPTRSGPTPSSPIPARAAARGKRHGRPIAAVLAGSVACLGFVCVMYWVKCQQKAAQQHLVEEKKQQILKRQYDEINSPEASNKRIAEPPRGGSPVAEPDGKGY